MIAQVLLCCVLIWSDLWTTASVTPEPFCSTEGDFINVTCAPVEVDGAIECEGSPYLRNQIYKYFADQPNPVPVECRVDLHTDVVDLPNVCEELPDKPGLTRCTATIPRHLHIMTLCRMIGATSAIGSLFLSPGKEKCHQECEEYTSADTCVVNEECCLCALDFRKNFPGVELERRFCEMAYHFGG